MDGEYIDYSYFDNILALIELHDLERRCGLPLTKAEDYKPYSEPEMRFEGQKRRKNGQFDFDDSLTLNKKRLTRRNGNGKIKAEKISNYEKEIVSSAIATNHPDLKADGTINIFHYGNYSYAFKVKSKCVYEFKGRVKIKGRVR